MNLPSSKKKPPVHTGLVIRHYAELYKIDINAFARRGGVSAAQVADLFEGRADLTTELAMAAERAMCIPARYFLDKWEDYVRHINSPAMLQERGIHRVMNPLLSTL